MVQMFVRTVVRMRIIVCRIPYYLYLSCSIFFVRISVSCLTLFFLVLLKLFFRFIYPLPMLQHADRMALFQRFAVVCFLNLLAPNWVLY